MTQTAEQPTTLAEAVETLSDAELAEFLKGRPTVADGQWKSRQGRKRRHKGESRSDFIDRVLAA